MPVLKTIQTPTPVLVWTDDLDRETERQLTRVGHLPILHHHVAVMPDAHAGRGSTIGTVLATDGALIPACVGVDIGCGMMAAQTNLRSGALGGKRGTLRTAVEEAIPVGFDENGTVEGSVRALDLWRAWPDLIDSVARDERLKRKALAQCGSLGGGNHFIEICIDGDDRVWLLLHSGSRNIGKVLADHHISAAKGAVRRRLERVPDPDLAYVTEGTSEFEAYVHDLRWAQDFASHNRREMMRRLSSIFERLFDNFRIEQTVNCHHNYADQETHFGKTVWVTRKGAVRARTGEMGIVPGSMGTSSFIVEGLGNPESFHSCSHGAGRRMSRHQAKNQFTTEDLARQTEGVECRRDRGVLDEIPAAYKDIRTVMKNQSDLVRVVAELKQVVCVKG